MSYKFSFFAFDLIKWTFAFDRLLFCIMHHYKSSKSMIKISQFEERSKNVTTIGKEYKKGRQIFRSILGIITKVHKTQNYFWRVAFFDSSRQNPSLLLQTCYISFRMLFTWSVIGEWFFKIDSSLFIIIFWDPNTHFSWMSRLFMCLCREGFVLFHQVLNDLLRFRKYFFMCCIPC